MQLHAVVRISTTLAGRKAKGVFPLEISDERVDFHYQK